MAKGYLYDNGDELISREEIDALPDVSEASQGDVLSLNASKEPVWSAPSGGGGGTKYVICSAVPSDDPSKLVVEFYDPDTDNVLTLQDLIDGGYTIAIGSGFASYFTIGGDSVDGYFFDGLIVHYIDTSNQKYYLGAGDIYTDLTATDFLFPIGATVVCSNSPSPQ